MYKISPSSLSLMKECPRCFWLAKHKIWKRPSSPFPSLPLGIDFLLKRYFDGYRYRNELPPEIRNLSLTENCKLFNNNILHTWKNNFKGISWTDDKGNIFCGAVDDILIKSKKLIVLDYKTRGFALKDNSYEYYQTQLDTYNFLLRKNGYETEDYSFLLFYIPQYIAHGEIVFSKGLVKVNTKTDVESLFNQSISLLEGPCPGESCGWCEKVEIEYEKEENR